MYNEILSKINIEENAYNMICIDGVVGVGKSTLMNILTEEGFVPFAEPVVDNPILPKFYEDRKRYSFQLQIFFLNHRFDHIKKAMKMENAVLDRSIYGDLIFAKMLRDNGEMDEEEFNIYRHLLCNMLEHLSPPKLMIYLESSVDEAMKKINKRGRECELTTEKEYWETLNKEYQNYFNEYDLSPVLKINVDNLDFENNLKDREYVINLIKNKLAEIDK